MRMVLLGIPARERGNGGHCLVTNFHRHTHSSGGGAYDISQYLTRVRGVRMTDELDSRAGNTGETGSADKLDGALTAVAKGLYHEPVLLFGFGVVLVLGVVGQVAGGRLLPAGWLIVGVYTASVTIWAATRHGRADGGAGTTEIPSSGEPKAQAHPAGTEIQILNSESEGSSITDTANVDDPASGHVSIVIDNSNTKKSQVRRSANIRPKSTPRDQDA